LASTAASTSYNPTSTPFAAGVIGRARRLADSRVLITGLVVCSALYVGWHLGRGWVPHDEGALGQSAVRVLQGELPHRDFDELYTGGLTFLNALAFRLFGTTLITMRMVLFAVFLAWIPAVFYVASGLGRPAAAAGVTILCVVWSLPNYPAPVPSWYNLFLAVFGIAALFRWLEDRRKVWLVAAGIAGGLSVLVKVVGLYYIAGVLLFLVFQAHEDAVQGRVAATPVDGGSSRRGALRDLGYPLFVSACLSIFVFGLVMLTRHQFYPAELVQFVVPGLLVASLLVRNEWTQRVEGTINRFAPLGRLVVPFIVGFAIPVVIFLVPFARAHALGALFNGVFVLPSKRFGSASFPTAPLKSMVALIPVALILAYGRRFAERMDRSRVLALALVLVMYIMASGDEPRLYRFVWSALRSALPVLVLLGVIVLARARTTTVRSTSPELTLLRSHTMLLLSVTAIFTLIQFPFSAPIYFCYIAPLLILLAVALLRHVRPMAPAVPRSIAIFLIAFAVMRVNTGTIYNMGLWYQPYPETMSLGFPRARLDVRLKDATTYRAAIPLLEQHARGAYTWASPDCPEIYFLSGLRNPTRSLFDFFDDENGRTTRILSTLERNRVTAIVLNTQPAFSSGIPSDLNAALEARYPFSADDGKFRIRWQ
jgi:hypothetical protein